MRADEVIIRPVLTEKSNLQKEELNKYSFVVSKRANKMQIADAIQELFGVTARQINIIKVNGKKKRVRYRYGYTASYKKAVITIKDGETISIFEGA
jgi:large subunit ribosomal protein L23